jgi:hypothetical protein
MCEFCIQHGEGKKWYLEMRNYSRELWAQEGRPEFMDDYGARFEERYTKRVALLDMLVNKPVVGGFIRRMAIRSQKAEHWGQVVPIEDLEQIVDLQTWIVRFPCLCRSVTTGHRDARYCFGIGVDMTDTLAKYPDAGSFEPSRRLTSVPSATAIRIAWPTVYR